MTVFLHIMTSVFCGAECLAALRDLRGRFPRLIMFAGLGLIHGIVPVLTRSDWTMWDASDRSRLLAALLALVGVILFSAGWRLLDVMVPRFRGLSPGLWSNIDSEQGQILLRRLFWACAIIGVTAWIAGVLLGGTALADVFRGARFARRLHGPRYAEAIAQYFVGLTVVPGFVCFFLPRRYQVIGILYSVSVAVVLFAASQGARAQPIGLLGCMIMGYAIRHRPRAGRVVLVGGAGLTLLFLAVALYGIRGKMSDKRPGELLALFLSAETYQDAMLKDPLNYHQFLIAAVELFPERHPFLNGATYRRLFVFFLPRQYFPSIKPRDTNMVFAEVLNPYAASTLTTVPPTMMGDGYINFWGFPGVGIMLVNGFAFGFVAYKMRSSMLWFVAMGAPFFRMGSLAIRGQPYEILLVAGWTLFIIWFLGRLMGYSYSAARQAGAYASAQGSSAL